MSFTTRHSADELRILVAPDSFKGSLDATIVFDALKKQLADIDSRFARPARFGSGKYMTLLVCEGYLKADGNGVVDLESTLVGLKRAEAALKDLHLTEPSCTE